MLIPEQNSITKLMIKYINTIPVSGSKNVNIEGIKVTIKTLKIKTYSLLFLFLEIIIELVIIRIIFRY